jgi:hypothetical protein
MRNAHVSFTIREIRDRQGYTRRPGQEADAEVKRDAIIGERTADREARAEAAAQDKTAWQAEAVTTPTPGRPSGTGNIRAAN